MIFTKADKIADETTLFGFVLLRLQDLNRKRNNFACLLLLMAKYKSVREISVQTSNSVNILLEKVKTPAISDSKNCLSSSKTTVLLRGALIQQKLGCSLSGEQRKVLFYL